MASTETYKLENRTYYRARPIMADGTKGSYRYGRDGKRFATRKAAKAYADEIEADIRRDKWQDPRSGDLLLEDWVNKWFPGQDIEDTTRDSYAWHIETHILPAFGKNTLRSLNTLDINTWELSLSRPGPNGKRICGESSAASARTLLHTILEDAIRLGMIPVNPAARISNRGRKSGRGDTAQEEVWFTDLEAFLVAERCAALAGRPDDFVHLITLAYTGMRWGESVGLERKFFRLSSVRVEQQVYERKGAWMKKPPKDGSKRTIHLPKFLSDLLSQQAQRHGDGACSCGDSERGCGGGKYMFRPDDGDHERRSNFGRRRFRPAVDGRHPDAKERPGYPVLADVAAAPWPGLVKRSWHAATPGQEFTPPRRRGFWTYDPEVHHLVSWGPILGQSEDPDRRGKVHGFRHTHKVMLDELLVPWIVSEGRLGHKRRGIIATYSHESPEMVAMVTEGLQARWERTLRQRAEMCGGRSSVPIVDALLAPARTAILQDRPRLVPFSVSAITG